jgi:hypothetical protein
MTKDGPWEWQCGYCGKWVGSGWSRHSHIEDVTPPFEEMVAARARGELPDYSSKVHNYFRTGKEPTRDAKL